MRQFMQLSNRLQMWWNSRKQTMENFPSLMLSMLGKNSAEDIFKYFFLIIPEKRIWHFRQIISIGDNLPEMLNPYFSSKNKIKKKYHQFVICWICS